MAVPRHRFHFEFDPLFVFRDRKIARLSQSQFGSVLRSPYTTQFRRRAASRYGRKPLIIATPSSSRGRSGLFRWRSSPANYTENPKSRFRGSSCFSFLPQSSTPTAHKAALSQKFFTLGNSASPPRSFSLAQPLAFDSEGSRFGARSRSVSSLVVVARSRLTSSTSAGFPLRTF